MPRLEQLASDLDLEVGGRRVVWKRGPFEIVCRIARFGNSKFVQKVRALAPEFATLSADEIADRAEELEPVVKEAMAETVIINIEDLEDDDGSPLPYAAKVGLQMLNDERLRDFYLFVLRESQASDAYMAAAKKEAAGN